VIFEDRSKLEIPSEIKLSFCNFCSAILISVDGQLMNYKNYNNGNIESAIQIKKDNEITEIRYLLGIGLYKIYSGENVDFYSEFGAEVAYSCQEKSNISATVDQTNLEELLNIYENIDFVFNTRDDKILNDDIAITGKENEAVATIKVEPRPNSIIKPGLCGEDNKGEDLVTLFSGKLTINDPELASDSFGLT